MPKRFSRIWAIIGCSLIISMLAACGAGTQSSSSTGSSSQSKVVIKIGSEFPTTAKDASQGKPAENGVALAVKEANDNNILPGYTFVLANKDDVGVSGTHDPTVGQKNVTDLIGDAQVAGIVGPLNSSVAQAELPVTNRAPIALISPSNTNNCLTQETPASQCGGANSKIKDFRPTGKVSYFRTAALDKYQGPALADYAYHTKGYKTVYVIDDTEAYGQGLANNFADYFTKIGGKVLGHQSVKSTDSYENILTQVAAMKPDLIFFGGNDSTGGITIRQQMARVPGLKNTPYEVGDGAKSSDLAKNIKPTASQAPVFASVPGLDPSKSPDLKKSFDAAYQKSFGNVGAYSYGAYDDAKIIINAVKTAITEKKATAPKDANDSTNASTFRQAVIDAIQGESYDGLTGHHSFDKNGDTTNKSVSVYTIADDVSVGDGWKFVDQVDTSKLNID